MKSVFAVLFLSLNASAQSSPMDPEPQFCKPSEFLKYEITNQAGVKQPGRKFERGRVFKINGVTIVGVGVGKSDHVGLQRMYHALAEPGASNSKYCTWYFNKGNDAAERVFNHYPMSKPSSTASKAGREWMGRLGGIFESNQNNFKKCMEEDKYIALGCDGQRHRGPTAFGMLLSYMGCSAENSEAITRNLWGLNGIKAQSRVAINREAYKVGQRSREVARLRAIEEGKIEPIREVASKNSDSPVEGSELETTTTPQGSEVDNSSEPSVVVPSIQ